MTLPRQAAMVLCTTVALTGCSEFDLDLRGFVNETFSTSEAARSAVPTRPDPDNRGVISYPNYQVAVAMRGDTLADVANRIGLPVADLAAFNGIAPDASLRKGEVIALPTRVAEPSPATGSPITGPIRPSTVDVTTLAGDAIANAPDTTPEVTTSALAPPVQSGQEPIRHQVERGETAFSVSRLYRVSVRDLAEWNGLGPDFALREGQYLLIPVATQAPPPQEEEVTLPGTGSVTPEPPSAKKPLPEVEEETPAEDTKPVVDIGETTTLPAQNAMAFPVTGKIIRDYEKGKNEGIDIQADAGANVLAADDGTVAAITESAEGVPIIVLRHPSNLLTVYANVASLKVKKGDTVKKGAPIARLRRAPDNFVHFEIRDGFDAVDPQKYLK